MWSNRVYVDHLKNVPLFSGFSRRDLQAVASVGQHLTVKQGTVLVEQDTEAYDAFVILSGTVQIKRNKRIAGEVGPGAIIGELSLLDRGPRTASAICETDCDVLVLSRSTFLAAIDQIPSLRHKLLDTLATKVRQLDRRAM